MDSMSKSIWSQSVPQKSLLVSVSICFEKNGLICLSFKITYTVFFTESKEK